MTCLNFLEIRHQGLVGPRKLVSKILRIKYKFNKYYYFRVYSNKYYCLLKKKYKFNKEKITCMKIMVNNY